MRHAVDLLVVGAGPTGLTAAAAAATGRSVHVVDAAGRVGGMAASITVAGVRADLGSHRLHPVAEPRVESMIRRLLGDDLQTRPRNGRFRLAGRWLRFPPQPIDLLRQLPPRFVVGATRDALTAPVRRSRTPDPDDPTTTFADVVRARLGPTMLDWFYGPYAEKLWGLRPDELAGELARRRIGATSTAALLARVARSARSTPSTFRYPRLGYGQLVEAIAAEARTHGARLDLTTNVVRLQPGADGVDVELGDGRQLLARRVFWTADPGALDRLLGRRAVAPRRRAMACVYLAYPTGRVSGFDAHYLPEGEWIASRISEPANYRDGPDPTDVTVLCAEVPCDHGGEWWCADDRDLGDRVHRDVVRLGLTGLDPVELHVERLPSVYPVLTPTDARDVADRRRATVPGVTVVGRQGLVVADNIHHVMAMALDAVDCLGPAGTTGWDDDGWSRALHRFDTHVVED